MPARSGLLLASMVFIAAAGVGLWAGIHWLAPTPEERRAELQRTVDATVLPRDYARLPNTAVHTAQGEPMREALGGGWSVLFLGFTHCPDVCPLTLQTLAATMDKWSSEEPRPKVAFVSVDPRRDTPADAGAYAARFDPEFLGASGEMAALRTLADRLRVDFEVPDAAADEQYGVEHPSQIFLLDPQGRLRAVFSPPFGPDTLARDLRTLIANLEPAA
ncbi:MAG: SCO family protein [Halofilum sp. (in: g-proteobacteria)]